MLLVVGTVTAQSSVGVDSTEIWIEEGTVQNELTNTQGLDELAAKLRSTTNQNPRVMAYANLFESHALKRSDVDQAILLGHQSLQYFKSQKDVINVLSSYLAIGSAQANSGDGDQAINTYQESMDFYNLHGDPTQSNQLKYKARILYNIGFTLLRSGELEKSTAYFVKAQKEALAIKDTLMLAHTYSQLGNINIYRENHWKAIEYNRKGLALLGDELDNSRAYMEGAIGASFGELSILDSARFYLEKVVAYRRQGTNKYSLAVALINLSDVDRQENNCPASDRKNREVYDITKSLGQKNLLLNSQINLCRCSEKRGEYYKALAYAKEGIEVMRQGLHYKTAADVYECASMAAEGLNLFDRSLQYFKLHKLYQDSLINEESEAAINELEVKFELANNKANLAQLEEAAKVRKLQYKQRLLWLSLIVALLAAAALTVYFYSRRQVLQEEKRRVEIEQKLLRFQMNPHFIFNAISSIQNYLFDKSDLKVALTYLSKFAELMRQTLEHSREIHIPLEKEISSLQNYLSLQQLRYQNRFEYELTIAPDIDPEDLLVPPLIAQPFVENAIEHGQIYQIPDGKVFIDIRLKDGYLQMVIKDNGVGMSELAIKEISSVKVKKSLATIITKERLAALSREGRQKFDLIIENLQQGGTMVTIDLPIIAAT